MTDSEFQSRILFLDRIPFREEFEAGLYRLYEECAPEQRDEIRRMDQAGKWLPHEPWKNPSDFDRRDLTREQRMRQSLLAMSIRDVGRDGRDDLRSIAYCYFNLVAVGVDADGALDELAKLSTPRFAQAVRNFRNRRDKDPDDWGMKYVQNPDGPAAEIYKA